ncbi:50S ribosomal protein L3 [bacterium]|nr:50S ribosomal protein L3 [bacterium]
MKKAILGMKVGMTQIYGDNGVIIPVTVIKAGPCVVVQKKTKEVDGYEAIKVGFGEISEKKLHKLSKPCAGQFAKHKVAPQRYLREFRLDDITSYEVGSEIKVDTFEVGERVDVVGTSKGKGFQGGMKRHNFGGGGNSHGSMSHRVPASSGATDAARVFPGTRKPGHMGNVRVTTQGLTVVGVDAEQNILLVKGSIPGPNNGLVTVKSTVKKYRQPVSGK